MQLIRIDRRLLGLEDFPRRRIRLRKRRHDRAHDLESVLVVFGEMIGDAGDGGMHLSTSELFSGHDLTGRRLHKRWTPKEDGALIANDHRFVAHCRDVGTARSARAHHRRDLGNRLLRELCLVEEDPTEVIAVWKHLVLLRQKRTAGVDEVDARQPVLESDLLSTKMLLDGDRMVRPALDRGVVCYDHALLPRNAADTGDDACAGHLAAIHAVSRHRRELEKG